jgi:hypothetical protein
MKEMLTTTLIITQSINPASYGSDSVLPNDCSKLRLLELCL